MNNTQGRMNNTRVSEQEIRQVGLTQSPLNNIELFASRLSTRADCTKEGCTVDGQSWSNSCTRSLLLVIIIIKKENSQGPYAVYNFFHSNDRNVCS